MSAILEVNNFLSRKAWILEKRSVVKSKGINPVPVKWVFKRKEQTGGLISIKSINVVKGYMKLPEDDFTQSLSPVALDISERMQIGLTLYYEDDGWIAELCDVKAAFLHPNMEVEIYIEWTEILTYL